MLKVSELNREYALKLSKLILDNPNMRVVAWIRSEGVSDDYAYWAGCLHKPSIETIAYSEIKEHYVDKEPDDYENCYAYYGSVADTWDDETLKKKAAEIPWEDVIAVKVSAT